MKDLLQIINKEFLLVARSGYGVFMPVAYLLIIMILFNISISFVDKKITQELIPLMIWISCLLICILNLATIFKDRKHLATIFTDPHITNSSSVPAINASEVVIGTLAGFPRFLTT